MPCGPVNTIDQVFEEPQALHRSLTVEQSRADLATPIRTVASPIRLSRTPVRYDAPPPKLGQDTDEILRGLRSEP
ncbi:formyl-coenzyme A transferase [compost metagenome]